MLQLLTIECTRVEQFLIHKYSKEQAWVDVSKLLLLLCKLDKKKLYTNTRTYDSNDDTIDDAIRHTNKKCHKKSFPMLH